jgi:hypothetical protein
MSICQSVHVFKTIFKAKLSNKQGANYFKLLATILRFLEFRNQDYYLQLQSAKACRDAIQPVIVCL